MLQEFNVTPAVGLVTTASLAIIPRMFSIAHLQKDNEELNKARKKELKLQVEHMVKEEIEKKPELAQTVLKVKNTTEEETDENSDRSELPPAARSNSGPTQFVTSV